VKKGVAAGRYKNLIFAANGPKPELVLVDALNNDIRIVRNQEYCLVYDLPIGHNGLRWHELVTWWSSISSFSDPERNLYRRLLESLSSVPERRFFRLYFETLRNDLGERLPAIIPQVYLHYDPYTLRELPGNGSALARQRMDFLFLLPCRQRVVIEIDGQQHYADGDVASPKRYAEMAAEDRNLRLQGYDVRAKYKNESATGLFVRRDRRVYEVGLGWRSSPGRRIEGSCNVGAVARIRKT
jgi:hypothetical protein